MESRLKESTTKCPNSDRDQWLFYRLMCSSSQKCSYDGHVCLRQFEEFCSKCCLARVFFSIFPAFPLLFFPCFSGFSVMVFVSFDGGSKLGSVFVTAMLVLFRLEAAWLPTVETPHISGIQPTLKELCHEIQPNWVIIKCPLN